MRNRVFVLAASFTLLTLTQIANASCLDKYAKVSELFLTDLRDQTDNGSLLVITGAVAAASCVAGTFNLKGASVACVGMGSLFAIVAYHASEIPGLISDNVGGHETFSAYTKLGAAKNPLLESEYKKLGFNTDAQKAAFNKRFASAMESDALCGKDGRTVMNLDQASQLANSESAALTN